jgi:hypothetical protein
MAAACSKTPDRAPNPCCSACREADSPDIRWWHCRVRVPTSRSDRRRNICSITSIAMCRSIVSLTASAWARAISSAASRPRAGRLHSNATGVGGQGIAGAWRPVHSDRLFEIGYEDIAFFRSLFKRHTGMTPAEYRNRFCPNELRSCRVSPWKVCGLKHDPPISNMSHLGALPFRGWYGSAFAPHADKRKINGSDAS